ncbi:hypothetical protein DYB32_003173 [Aphanomyces invadans]|uniref:Uncharacterized protein n=1 Tax=Aphanomyces invadans TaxID=157072 RepID=A0A3R7D3S8_9STRA|nr:hypothetical protein DYB32_003173 [Aphanomyces invadans]
MSSIRGLLQRKQEGAAAIDGGKNNEEMLEGCDEYAAKSPPTEKRKMGGFGFGSLVAPKFMTGLKNLNPLKNLGKKSPTKPGTMAPPAPLKQIAWLFGPKYRHDLWRVCPYLALADIGKLAQVNEATNEHLIAYFRSPQWMGHHIVSTRYVRPMFAVIFVPCMIRQSISFSYVTLEGASAEDLAASLATMLEHVGGRLESLELRGAWGLLHMAVIADLEAVCNVCVGWR